MEITDPLHAYLPFLPAVKSSQAQILIRTKQHLFITLFKGTKIGNVFKLREDVSKYYIKAVSLQGKFILNTKRYHEKTFNYQLISRKLCTPPGTKTTKIPNVYKPVRSEMYKKGWIDFNKNGVKDTYEDPTAPIDARIEDLLSQMTLEEKTCQMVTLYGYKRVLKDDLPTSEWKNQLWKDGIGAIDEHLNGFQQWGLPPSDNEYVWPASKHAWALNEVQRFFIEETRLGIPTDFTNRRDSRGGKVTKLPTSLLNWDWDIRGTVN